MARDSYSQIFKADPGQPWLIRNFHHLLISYERDMLFINMSNIRMEGSSVTNIPTLIFGYDATMHIAITDWRHMNTCEIIMSKHHMRNQQQ
jgi:hypothetical protein